MYLLTSIESSAFAEYIRVSAYGYAAMITLHSLGLAVMVGLSLVLSLRVLGLFSAIPNESLPAFLRIAWVGFIVNLLSGTSLFVAQATTYVTDPEFLLKMLFVLLGAVFVALLQSAVSDSAVTRTAVTDTPLTSAAAEGGGTRGNLRAFYAIATIGAWSCAMVAGRLIAYL